MRTITRNHVQAGCIAPKTIENGVTVPPGLQVNSLTLEEHRRRLARLNLPPLTPKEEARIHPTEAKNLEDAA
ncbi:MAG: hypothetical protein V3S55_06290 [Nitrospiraceae bacterium]